MKPLLLARLTGTQEEMGAQHGRLVAGEAAALFASYRTMPERALGGDLRGPIGAIGRAVIRGIATAWQARLVHERPPELAARTHAFIAAVRATTPVARDARLTLATMDSLQNFVALIARGRIGPFANPLRGRAVAAAVPACSTAIAWGDATTDGELLFARNFDFPGVGTWDAAPAFVVCAPDRGQRYGFFSTRGADAPVVTVVNEAGLVIAPHTRWHRGVTFGGAMIVDLVHTLARRAETLADAVAIARETPASSCWGIAIGSARERSALVLELAGPLVDVVRPDPGAPYLICTNHYRSPLLQQGEVAGSAAWSLHSDRRSRRLRALIEQRAAPLDAPALARFLGDRYDADAPSRRRQLGAIVAQPNNVHAVVVAPTARRALVGIDRAPSCEGTWAEVTWSWDGPAGGWELGAAINSGFTAIARTDIAAAHDAATLHMHAASNAYELDHDLVAACAALERAIAADPDDPSLRLTAAWLALAADAPDRAMIHIHAGLARETDGYRRGQLLLWGARAARRDEPALARQWTEQLGRMAGQGIDELIRASQRRYRGRPHANLMMADAY